MSQLDETPTTTVPTAADVVCDSGRTVVDVRGPRFGAAVTTVVLGLILLTIPSPVSVALLVWQTVVFGLGALVGLQAQPYGVFFRRVVRPRIGEATEFEDAAPPRFAQTVGLLFALVGLAGLLLGVTVVAYVAVAFAFAAAFLNAAFAFCLGCEVYLLGKRVLSRG
jgi:hypothetical protein